LHTAGVAGSNPAPPTKKLKHLPPPSGGVCPSGANRPQRRYRGLQSRRRARRNFEALRAESRGRHRAASKNHLAESPVKALAVLLAALLPASVPFPSVAGATAGGPLAATAVDPNEAVDRFIIRLRDGAADPQPALARIAGTFGERLDHVRAMSGGTHVVRLGRTVA